jgi:hypothetical protein
MITKLGTFPDGKHTPNESEKESDVTGVWRKLHNDDLHNLYSSQNDVRVIKSKGMIFHGM